MLVHLVSPLGSRTFDDETGGFIDGARIPCHRCGACCRRWQPLLSRDDVTRLAAFTGESEAAFRSARTRPYPFDDDLVLLTQRDGACQFLTADADGRSACAVHPARPDICRTWTASLLRRECVDGFDTFARGGLTTAARLYPDPDDRATFARVCAGESRP